MEKDLATYTGAERDDMQAAVNQILRPLEEKYGAAMPVDEACRVLTELENIVDK
jgi:hypothetical protein